MTMQGNTRLPPYMIEAWDHVCPYCKRPPKIEHLGADKFQLKCHDYECPVMPSALPAPTLEAACRDWTARVELTNTSALLTLQNGEPIEITEDIAEALSEAFYGMNVPRIERTSSAPNAT